MFMHHLFQNIKSIIFLPTPSTINYMWNFGSLLGFILFSQILTGFFLSMFYNSDSMLAFESVIHIMNNINHGWIIRFIHSTGASVFFIFIYLHIGKALFFKSFYLWKTWLTGLIIILILMASAFLGYVLPWGQMSLWGATVITNLISVIPYVGEMMVMWIWGGFNVGGPTLSRFFSFHFLFPFILLLTVILHLFFLHETGSSNPLGISMNIDKIYFKNYFIIKDLLTLLISILILLWMSMMMPFLFMDSENFIKANPMITPLHIQPEWYFLFAYCVLRAIPNKMGGVLMLLMSILIIMILPLLSISKMKSNRFGGMMNFFIFNLFNLFIILTWLGMKTVEPPFIMLSQIYTILYFMNFLILIL